MARLEELKTEEGVDIEAMDEALAVLHNRFKDLDVDEKLGDDDSDGPTDHAHDGDRWDRLCETHCDTKCSQRGWSRQAACWQHANERWQAARIRTIARHVPACVLAFEDEAEMLRTSAHK